MSERHLVARGIAVWAAISLGGFAASLGSAVFTPGAQPSESLLAALALIIVPAALAVVFAWWAWQGWALTPQPKWVVAARWGVFGGMMWAVSVTLFLAAWQVWVRGLEPGNLVGLPGFLTAPAGFVLGAVAGWVKASRR
jgi:hypothetical protein